MRESMFYVGASSIERVWEDPGTVKFRGVLREGSKVRPWEALLQFVVLFGCPWRSRLAQFSAKRTIFGGSENLMIPQTDLSVGVLAVLVEGRWSYLAAAEPSNRPDLL